MKNWAEAGRNMDEEEERWNLTRFVSPAKSDACKYSWRGKREREERERRESQSLQ